MIQYVQTDESGRILCTTPEEEFASEDMFEFDFPNDFPFHIQDEYRIVDGELVQDPRPESVENQIRDLKQKLSDTDWVATKLLDYQIMGKAISEDESDRYSDILIQREEWRSQINELEVTLDGQRASEGKDLDEFEDV